MKIKLKSKDKPVPNNMVFMSAGHCLTLINEINSGKLVDVDKISKVAAEYVEEVKKETHPQKPQGNAPKGDK